jgi:methylated-DNA-protein-cysteine methyltransferase-like protein
MRSATPANSYHAIWQVVAQIPRGTVATYGQVARLAGLPRQARLVGYALHRLPAERKLPWHRVVNAKGQLSFPLGSDLYCLQRDLLIAEGIVFDAAHIDLTQFAWQSEAV